eukprot:SAG22_NODE_30_length_28348_cov_12.488584_21_plen_224_part_00
MTWGLAPGKSTFASRENGGQWFSKLANQQDGSPPPAGSPGWMMNVGKALCPPPCPSPTPLISMCLIAGGVWRRNESVGGGDAMRCDAFTQLFSACRTIIYMSDRDYAPAGGGNRFALGEYYPGNESWITDVATATIDSGPNSNWEYAGFVGAVKGDKDKRFMNIGWETGGPPMMSAVKHVSQRPASPWSHDATAAQTCTRTRSTMPTRSGRQGWLRRGRATAR